MGYRNSAPTNIMIGESKMLIIKHRVELLAMSFLNKKLIIEEEKTERTMNRLMRRERKKLIRNLNKEKSILYTHTQREKN